MRLHLIKPCAGCVVFVTMLFAVPSAKATLYGMSGPGSGSGQLYTLNPSSGAATLAANLSGAAIFPSLGGLDFLGSTLYATGVYAGSPTYNFGTIDINTGAFTTIIAQDQANWQGLAGNSAAGVLYTVGTDNSPYILKSVTPSGVITNIGQTTASGSGLAYDNANGILYATSTIGGIADLVTLNTSTGASTLVGSLGLTNDAFGLAYDSAANKLYLNDGNTNSLYSVNTSTGLGTLIGANGVTTAIDALAYVPEPTSLASVCLATLLLARRRVRKS